MEPGLDIKLFIPNDPDRYYVCVKVYDDFYYQDATGVINCHTAYLMNPQDFKEADEIDYILYHELIEEFKLTFS